MTYSKYNKDKHLNIKLGNSNDARILNEESEALLYKEQQDLELGMLRESVAKYNKSEMETKNNIQRRQKYLNESNYFALKHYATKLAITQAKGLYDFNVFREEMGVDPEELIATEVEEQMTVEIPLEIQGEMGTVIPIKIETTPETADVVQAVVGLMNANNGDNRMHMDTGQVEDSAIAAVEELPEDNPEFMNATDEIADDTINIISKDQQIISGIKAKMDEIELRVAGNEEILAQMSGTPYDEPVGPVSQGEPKLVQDPETGLLVDPETGEVYDPETGELIQEEFHREHKISTVLEALAVNKANKMIREGFDKYNRDVAMLQGVNTLIVKKTFDHIFGRKQSYAEMKNELKIK